MKFAFSRTQRPPYAKQQGRYVFVFYNIDFLCKIKILIEHHSSDKVFPDFDIYSQFKHDFQLVKQPNDHKTPGNLFIS